MHATVIRVGVLSFVTMLVASGCSDRDRQCKKLGKNLTRFASDYGMELTPTEDNIQLFLDRCSAWPDRFFECYATPVRKDTCEDAYEAIETTLKDFSGETDRKKARRAKMKEKAPEVKGDPAGAAKGPAPTWQVKLPAPAKQVVPLRDGSVLASWRQGDGAEMIGRIKVGALSWSVAKEKMLWALPSATCVVIKNQKQLECLAYETGEPEWTAPIPEPVERWTAAAVDSSGARVLFVPESRKELYSADFAQCKADYDEVQRLLNDPKAAKAKAREEAKAKAKAKREAEKAGVPFDENAPKPLDTCVRLQTLVSYDLPEVVNLFAHSDGFVVQGKTKVVLLDAYGDRPILVSSVAGKNFLRVGEDDGRFFAVEEVLIGQFDLFRCRDVFSRQTRVYPMRLNAGRLRECGRLYGQGGPYGDAVVAGKRAAALIDGKLRGFGDTKWRGAYSPKALVSASGQVIAAFDDFKGTDLRAIDMETGGFLWRTPLKLGAKPRLIPRPDGLLVVSGDLVYDIPL